MAGYAELPRVRTWYDERGEGEPLVLMHGGVVDARFFDQNLGPLAERFHVYVPERRGHGHTPDVEGPITYDLMTDDTIEFLERVVGEPAHIVAHSDGAFIALLIAIRRPELVRDLVLISGGFHKDGSVPGADEIDVDQVVQAFGASYGEVSPDGEAHYPVVVAKIAEMAKNEPTLDAEEVNKVRSRTLVMAADDDIIVLEHILDLYRRIEGSELAVVPGTSHFLLQEKPELCNKIIVDFLTVTPVQTIAPVRRPGAWSPD